MHFALSAGLEPHKINSSQTHNVRELFHNSRYTLLCCYISEVSIFICNYVMKVKGTVQWVSAADAVDVELYKYESLLVDPKDGVTDFNERLNPNSLTVVKGAKAEKFAVGKPGDTFQFMRMAYYKFAGYSDDGTPKFYRIVELKDSFNKR